MTESLKDLSVRLEHYITPEWAVKAILKKEIMTRLVLDPAAGTGVLGEASKQAGYRVNSWDVQDWGYPLDHVHDFLTPGASQPFSQEFTVIMNPPFSKAEQFVERSFELGARKIVMFQRMAFFESEARREFWDRNKPEKMYVCGNRADCWRYDLPVNEKGQRIDPETGRVLNGTSTAHAWFILSPGYKGSTIADRIYRTDAL